MLCCIFSDSKSAKVRPDDSSSSTKKSDGTSDDYMLEEVPSINNAQVYGGYPYGDYGYGRPRRYGKWQATKYQNRGLILGLLDVLLGTGVTGTNHRKRWDRYRNKYVYSNEWTSGERRGWGDPDYYDGGYYGDYYSGDNDGYYPRRFGYGYPSRYEYGGGYSGNDLGNAAPRRFRKVQVSGR